MKLVECQVDKIEEVEQRVLPAEATNEDAILKEIISDVLMRYVDDKSEKHIAEDLADEILVEVNKYENK